MYHARFWKRQGASNLVSGIADNEITTIGSRSAEAEEASIQPPKRWFPRLCFGTLSIYHLYQHHLPSIRVVTSFCVTTIARTKSQALGDYVMKKTTITTTTTILKPPPSFGCRPWLGADERSFHEQTFPNENHQESPLKRFKKRRAPGAMEERKERIKEERQGRRIRKEGVWKTGEGGSMC